MTTMIAPSPPAKVAPTTVEVNVQLRPIDLYRAERTLVWRQVRMMVLVAGAFVLLRAAAGGGLLLLAVIGVISLFCLAVHSGFLYMGAKSTLQTNRILSGSMHYSFELNGLVMRGPTYWGHQDWSNLHDALETRHVLILRSSSAQKYVIPKRCLAPGDLERLRVLARPGKPSPLTAQHPTAPTNASRLTIRVRMTADDLYRGFLTLLARKSYWYAGQLAFSFVLIFALNPRFLSPIAFVGVGALFFFYLAAHLYWASARAIRTNAAYKNEIEYAFDKSGLESAGPTFSYHHDWCNFRSILEDSKIFLLCPSSSQMLIVPKRSFTDATQITALRQLLRTHYQGKLSLKH